MLDEWLIKFIGLPDYFEIEKLFNDAYLIAKKGKEMRPNNLDSKEFHASLLSDSRYPEISISGFILFEALNKQNEGGDIKKWDNLFIDRIIKTCRDFLLVIHPDKRQSYEYIGALNILTDHLSQVIKLLRICSKALSPLATTTIIADSKEESNMERKTTFDKVEIKATKKRRADNEAQAQVKIRGRTKIPRRVDNEYELKSHDDISHDIISCISKIMSIHSRKDEWYPRTFFLSCIEKPSVKDFLDEMEKISNQSTHRSYTQLVKSSRKELLKFCRRKLDAACNNASSIPISVPIKLDKFPEIIYVKRDSSDRKWLFKIKDN